MCGIAGVVGDASPEAVERVARLLGLLAHRGPDGAGLEVLDGAVLGHRRLAIHDLSDAGAQPFRDDAARRAAVVNGQFHNHATLRADVLAHGGALRGTSDSELLLPLFARDGDDVVLRLRGPFAFAVYDAPSRTLTLARDRLGKKPLFYALAGGALWFASECGALARALGRRPRQDVLPAFLRCGYVPPPDTAFEGIFALPPAHVLRFSAGVAAPRLRRYWAPPLPAPAPRDAAAVAAAFEELFREAVRLRLSSDRPVGVLLSGGLDSAATLAVANERATAPLVAYTGAFDVRAYDESAAAADLARRLGSPHRVVRCDEGAADRLRALVATTGELCADSSALALAAVCAAAREETPVLLAGDGGDETLLGYDRHRVAAFPDARLRVAALLGRLPGFRTSPRVAKAAAIAGLPARAAYAELSALTLASTLDGLLAPEARAAADPLLARYAVEPDPGDVAADSGRLDVLAYLPEDLLVKADRASMLSGVEIWSPFLDPACVEFALRLPGVARTDARRGKLPLRALLERRGLSDLLARKKRGFGVPLRSWLLDGPLAAHAAEVLDGVREPFRGVLKDGSATPLWERLRGGEPLEHVVYACVVAATHADAFR